MGKPLKENEFECYICHQVFEKEWTDKEANEEYKKEFSDYEDEPKEIVCDDCYEKFMERIK